MLTKEEVIFESPPVKFPVGYVKNGVKLNNNIRNVNHNNNIVKMSEILSQSGSPSGACVKYVHSKVTLYYSSRVELKWRRALHHCQSCDFGGAKGENSPCGAIHYGQCTPVTIEQLVSARKLSRPMYSGRQPHIKSGSSHIGLPSGKHHSTSHYPTSHSSAVYIQVIT